MQQASNVGIFLFDDMTMLDGYAPLQILSFVESFEVFTVARSRAPLRADCGALLTPDHDFDSCPPLDILVVPGGGNVLPPMTDAATLDFLRRAAGTARYVTSVCSGALILAEAGLLEGYRATTHWAYLGQLAAYPGVEVVDQRVVVDCDRVSGGGVTAGIDFALTLIAEAVDAGTAQALQLLFEYRPQPPFDAGSPASAPAAVRQAVEARVAQVTAPLDAHLARKGLYPQRSSAAG